MDAVPQISGEIFSNIRPINITNQQSLDFPEENPGRSFDASSFIDMDLDFFSMRWSDSLDFTLRHQICFNGDLVIPDPIASPDSVLLPPSKSSSSSLCEYSDSSMMTPGRFGDKQGGKNPAKILKRCLYFLVPLYRKVRMLKMISSKGPRRSRRRMIGDGDRRRPVMNRVYDVEVAASSIHDAVLHCKKSNGECFGEEKSG